VEEDGGETEGTAEVRRCGWLMFVVIYGREDFGGGGGGVKAAVVLCA